MARIQLLEGSVRHYDWGSRTALAALQGRPVPAPRPEAELWLGAHPRGPARVLTDAGPVDLRDWIAAAPLPRLGRRVVELFGHELPFLVKLLAVERPLSLQVHPDATQAREGFAREQAADPPAPLRSYADPRAKPELVCALSRFRALLGFRPWPEIVARLDAARVEGVPGLPELRRRPGPDTGRALLAGLLTLDRRQVRRLVRCVVSTPASAEDPALAWVARLARAHPEEPAVLAPLLLGYVDLEPGQALYLPPGELHCYLEGVAVEVMASSDNVVRAGLTSKHVDVEELLRITRSEPRAATPLQAVPASAREAVFALPVREFEVARIRIGPGEEHRSAASGGLEILLCVEGEARIAGGPVLGPGRAAVVPATAAAWGIRGPAQVYRVRVPAG